MRGQGKLCFEVALLVLYGGACTAYLCFGDLLVAAFWGAIAILQAGVAYCELRLRQLRAERRELQRLIDLYESPRRPTTEEG